MSHPKFLRLLIINKHSSEMLFSALIVRSLMEFFLNVTVFDFALFCGR